MTIEGLQVVHALPGRVRLKVAGVKGNPVLARQAEEKLAQVPGITRVEAQPTTGSLLVHYDLEQLCSLASIEMLSVTLRELFPEVEVADLAGELACLAEKSAPAAGAPVTTALAGSLQSVNTRVAQLTGGLDLRLLLPLTLVFLGLRRLWTSEKVGFPSWSDYLWFGFSTFVMLNRGLVDGTAGTAAAAASAVEPKAVTPQG